MLKDALPQIKTALPGPKAKAIIERRKNAVQIPSAVLILASSAVAKGR